MIPCWSCKGPVGVGALFCETCKAVQAPAAVTHFQRLGLEVGFDVDVAALDQLYFDLQRQLHPDSFATKTVKEKALSQQQATALNDAYETLKDPLHRADYMVHLLAVDGLPKAANTVHDQAVLMEAMEMRERLESIETMADLKALAKATKADTNKVISGLSEAFHDGDIETACKLTTRFKYLQKMLGEVRHVRARLMA
ncbi:MAG: Fe-S protein assembly co-chaperone HscB [Magnetovibrio sp.]|nr:Fe-S protein assembly co-chaperone HscB [Magnetovibrio sp.]